MCDCNCPPNVDVLAAMAMQALIPISETIRHHVPQTAYFYADLMIAERERRAVALNSEAT